MGQNGTSNPPHKCQSKGLDTDAHNHKGYNSNGPGKKAKYPQVSQSLVVKESTHVEGTNIRLCTEHHNRIGGPIQSCHCPQQQASDGLKPLRHGQMIISKDALHTACEVFQDSKESVEAKGHGLYGPEERLDGAPVMNRHGLCFWHTLSITSFPPTKILDSRQCDRKRDYRHEFWERSRRH